MHKYYLSALQALLNVLQDGLEESIGQKQTMSPMSYKKIALTTCNGTHIDNSPFWNTVRNVQDSLVSAL